MAFFSTSYPSTPRLSSTEARCGRVPGSDAVVAGPTMSFLSCCFRFSCSRLIHIAAIGVVVLLLDAPGDDVGGPDADEGGVATGLELLASCGVRFCSPANLDADKVVGGRMSSATSEARLVCATSRPN